MSEHFGVAYKPTQRVRTLIVDRHRIDSRTFHSKQVNMAFTVHSFGQSIVSLVTTEMEQLVIFF